MAKTFSFDDLQEESTEAEAFSSDDIQDESPEAKTFSFDDIKDESASAAGEEFSSDDIQDETVPPNTFSFDDLQDESLPQSAAPDGEVFGPGADMPQTEAPVGFRPITNVSPLASPPSGSQSDNKIKFSDYQQGVSLDNFKEMATAIYNYVSGDDDDEKKTKFKPNLSDYVSGGFDMNNLKDLRESATNELAKTPDENQRLQNFVQDPVRNALALSHIAEVIAFTPAEVLGEDAPRNESGEVMSRGDFAAEIAKGMPQAMADEFMQYIDAARDGTLSKVVSKNPGDATANFLAVMSLGGGVGLSVFKALNRSFKKVATKSRLTGRAKQKKVALPFTGKKKQFIDAMDSAIWLAEAGQIGLDPVGGAMTKVIGAGSRAAAGQTARGIKSVVGAAKRSVTPPPLDRRVTEGAPPEGVAERRVLKGGDDAAGSAEDRRILPFSGMEIDSKPQPKKSLRERVSTFLKESEKLLADENYYAHAFARKNTGEGDRNALSNKLRNLGGLQGKITAIIKRTGYRQANDPSLPIKRDLEYSTAPEWRGGIADVIGELDDVQAQQLAQYHLARRIVNDADTELELGVDFDEAMNQVNQFDPEYINPATGVQNVAGPVHKAWEKVMQAKQDRLVYMRDRGLITQNDYKNLSESGKNYAPISRVTDESDYKTIAKKTGLKEGFLKPLKGSKKQIMNTIVTDLLLHERIIRMAEINRVHQKFGEWASRSDSGVTVARREVEKVDSAGNITKEWVDASGRTVEEQRLMSQTSKHEAAIAELHNLTDPDAKALAREAESERAIYNQTRAGLKDNQLMYKENGLKVVVDFDDAEVAQTLALLNFNPDSVINDKIMRGMTNILSGPAKLQRMGVTGDPSFGLITNMPRDKASAFVYSRYGFIPGIDSARGIMDFIGKGQVYESWAHSGGMQSGMNSIDRNMSYEAIRKMLRTRKGRKKIGKMFEKAMLPVDALQYILELSEASTRLGTFGKGLQKEFGWKRPKSFQRGGLKGESLDAALQRARDEGVDMETAFDRIAADSREASGDFAQSGASPGMKGLQRITAFLRAQIVGTSLLHRNVARATPKDRRIMAAKASALTAVAIGTWLMIKDDPEYQEATQQEKDMFLFYRLPPELGGEMIRIPKAHELGMLTQSLPIRFLERISDTDPDAMEGLAGSFHDIFIPSVTPTLIAPVRDIMMDKNWFFDSKLTPAHLDDLNTSEKYRLTTSEAAKAISAMTHSERDNTGGYSPIEVDHMMKQLTGTLGKTALTALDPLIHSIRDTEGIELPDQYEGPIGSTSVIRRLVRKNLGQTAAVKRFYKGFESHVANYRTFKRWERENPAKIQEFINKYPEEGGTIARYLNAESVLSQYQDAIGQAYHDTDMSGAEKRQKIRGYIKGMDKVAREALWQEREDKKLRLFSPSNTALDGRIPNALLTPGEVQPIAP